jgi:hypothetical protein
MLPSLHLFIKQEARQAANRLLGIGCSYVPNFVHSGVLMKITDGMTLLLAPRDKFVALYIFDRKFSADFPNKRGLVYGICRFGCTGWIRSLLACLKYCNLKGIVNKTISICSDFKSFPVSSRVVQQCGDSLQELALSNRNRLVWVFEHCGINGNKKPDAITRARSGTVFVRLESYLPLVPSSDKRSKWEWLLKSHSASWSLETACRQSRIWLQKPNPGLTTYLLKLPRSELVGLITGHCPLNKHLHNMGLIDEPLCIACRIEDESTHKFCEFHEILCE